MDVTETIAIEVGQLQNLIKTLKEADENLQGLHSIAPIHLRGGIAGTGSLVTSVIFDLEHMRDKVKG